MAVVIEIKYERVLGAQSVKRLVNKRGCFATSGSGTAAAAAEQPYNEGKTQGRCFFTVKALKVGNNSKRQN